MHYNTLQLQRELMTQNNKQAAVYIFSEFAEDFKIEMCTLIMTTKSFHILPLCKIPTSKVEHFLTFLVLICFKGSN